MISSVCTAQIGCQPTLGHEDLDHGTDEMPQDKGLSGLPEKIDGCLGRLAKEGQHFQDIQDIHPFKTTLNRR